MRLRIAFATSNDPTNIRSWSGTSRHMYMGLKSFADVEPICPTLSRLQRLSLRRWKPVEILTGKKFLPKHSISYSLMCARYIQRRLKGKKFDLIFAPAASAEIAFLKTDLPLVYLSDATFSLMIDYYERFSNLSNSSIEQGNLIEERTLSRASRIIMSSRWAAESVVNNYSISPEKVSVMLFGPNIEIASGKKITRPKKLSPPIRLLFVGVDWSRKGGETACNAMKELNNRGVETYLTVCGCVPPSEFTDSRMKVIPFLDKSKPDELEAFYRLFEEAHLFVLPTRAECSGMVLGEAAAFGLPALTTRTGGLEDAFLDGVSGFLIDSPDDYLEYVEKIISLIKDDRMYPMLCQGALNRSRDVLNWETWTAGVRSVLADTVL